MIQISKKSREPHVEISQKSFQEVLSGYELVFVAKFDGKVSVNFCGRDGDFDTNS